MAENFWNKQRIKQLIDVRNIALYIFAIIVLATTWSSAKAVQKNYELQKQVAALKQQNDVIKLENQNAALQNKYLESDQYLELTARQNLGLASPGEKVALVPKETALKHVDPSLRTRETKSKDPEAQDTRSRYAKNLEDWRNFLLGRKLTEN